MAAGVGTIALGSLDDNIIFCFIDTMPRIEVFARFQSVALFVAIFGIVQFFPQFAGVSIFTFLPTVPDQFTVEPLFNVESD